MCEEYKGELWSRASEQVRCGWVRMSNHSDNDIPNPMGWAGRYDNDIPNPLPGPCFSVPLFYCMWGGAWRESVEVELIPILTVEGNCVVIMRPGLEPCCQWVGSSKSGLGVDLREAIS